MFDVCKLTLRIELANCVVVVASTQTIDTVTEKKEERESVLCTFGARMMCPNNFSVFPSMYSVYIYSRIHMYSDVYIYIYIYLYTCL